MYGIICSDAPVDEIILSGIPLAIRGGELVAGEKRWGGRCADADIGEISIQQRVSLGLRRRYTK